MKTDQGGEVSLRDRPQVPGQVGEVLEADYSGQATCVHSIQARAWGVGCRAQGVGVGPG